MFSGHYSNPSGFCFDIACTDEPINDNPKLQGYNVEEKVKHKLSSNFFFTMKYKFCIVNVNDFSKNSSFYRHNHFMI